MGCEANAAQRRAGCDGPTSRNACGRYLVFVLHRSATVGLGDLTLGKERTRSSNAPTTVTNAVAAH